MDDTPDESSRGHALDIATSAIDASAAEGLGARHERPLEPARPDRAAARQLAKQARTEAKLAARARRAEQRREADAAAQKERAEAAAAKAARAAERVDAETAAMESPAVEAASAPVDVPLPAARHARNSTRRAPTALPEPWVAEPVRQAPVAVTKSAPEPAPTPEPKPERKPQPERKPPSERKPSAKSQAKKDGREAKQQAAAAKAAQARKDDHIVEAPREPKKPWATRLRPAGSGRRIVSVAAGLVGALGLLCSVILAVGALLVAIGADEGGAFYDAVTGTCDVLVGPLRDAFSFEGANAAMKESLVAWGAGSIIYLVVGIGTQSFLRSLGDD